MMEIHNADERIEGGHGINHPSLRCIEAGGRMLMNPWEGSRPATLKDAVDSEVRHSALSS